MGHLDSIDEETAATIQAMLVPVRGAEAITITSHTGSVRDAVIVYLDASKRPDVADLRRVVESQGGLQQRSNRPLMFPLEPGSEGMIVIVDIANPVDLAFAFFLPWPKYDALFDVLLETECLQFTPGALEHAGFEALGLRIDRTLLQPALAYWRSRGVQ